jgi:hypothetical protein
MLYSIQNSGGQVYGIYEAPAALISPEVMAATLKDRLSDIVGLNGVVDAPLRSSNGSKEDRILIDIVPYPDEEARLERVHRAIGQIAREYPL